MQLRLRGGVLDLDARRVHGPRGALRLTELECAALAHLAARPGEVVTREALLVEVWGYAEGVVSRAVDHTMSRLRKKIEVDPAAPDHLETVFGGGYRLRLGPRAGAASVPAARDPFVGRTPELTHLCELRDAGARMITLTGPAGVGKSRLARQYAATEAASSGARVLLCSLESATTSLQLCIGVAGALEVSLGSVAVQQVGAELARLGPGLLVLDNLEQLGEAARGPLRAWLDQAPALTLMATSRRRLGVRGEHVLSLDGLDPADAVRLWALRVRQVRADYDVAQEDEAALARVLDELDRLPLALEMAAARMGIWELPQLERALRERFSVLVREDASVDRHRSMAVALAWSWEALSPDAQAALRALAVFRGSFALDAAQAVAGPDRGPVWLADLLRTLVDHSLVQRCADNRFRLLRTVADFIEQAGLDPAAKARHMAWFAAWGAPARRARIAACPQVPARDLANVAVAAERASGSPTIGPLVLALWTLVDALGPASAGWPLLLEAIATPGLEPRVADDLLAARVQALRRLGNPAGARAAARALGPPELPGRAALAIHLGVDDSPDLAVLGAHSPVGAWLVARIHARRGQLAQALDGLERALQGLPPREALVAQAMQAHLFARLGQRRAASATRELALERWERVYAPRAQARAQLHLARLERDLGRPALDGLDEAIASSLALGEPALAAEAQALMASLSGDSAEALRAARAAADLATRADNDRVRALAYAALAEVRLAEGAWPEVLQAIDRALPLANRTDQVVLGLTLSVWRVVARRGQGHPAAVDTAVADDLEALEDRPLVARLRAALSG